MRNVLFILVLNFNSARHLTKMPSRYLGGILHLKICPKSAPLFRHVKIVVLRSRVIS